MYLAPNSDNKSYFSDNTLVPCAVTILNVCVLGNKSLLGSPSCELSLEKLTLHFLCCC